ncbi:Glycosyl transferase family 2 protein [Candidatus Erwinia haradaeae]|uniref:Glycosyl transferase family 2 protein n=1 Tax=Candidatus Erwinia haradaeae TaxID=1922217 RepID=A0A451DJ66_9GAMM|nr:glycosyltransferase family 2 protein [Candidatus Erwinia haradaeae]VFP86716.1 Glycosyl transferase family 2 protein [Candidatus Erwinia haradaeae]
MKKLQKLSAVIITHNAEEVLAECLESVSWADEIILLDFKSSDKTLDIAVRYGVMVYQSNTWPGYGKQRQIAQSYANYEMILMIDSDERVTTELQQSINLILQQPPAKIVYSISRCNVFLGQAMRHGGWYPDRVIRLYPSCYAYNNHLVHESLDVSAIPIRSLHGDLLHLTSRDFCTFQLKQCSYAKAWAKQRYQKGKHYSITKIIYRSFWSFIRTLLVRGSFLDGTRGWLLAIVVCQYTFNKYVALWDLNCTSRNRN